MADIETWQPFATVWASKLDVSDGERVAAAEVSAQITTRFQILWSRSVADVSPRDRCECQGLTYDIVAVKELGRRDGFDGFEQGFSISSDAIHVFAKQRGKPGG